MASILNLTQHDATFDQIRVGVIEPRFGKDRIKELLTFETIPTEEEIESRAKRLSNIALDLFEGRRGGKVMIGGAPYLMPALVAELKARGFTPLFSFTRRETEEEVQPDGSIRKISVFRHIGWVHA